MSRLSRRLFLAASSAAPAAAAPVVQMPVLLSTVKADQTPLLVASFNQFHKDELAVLQAAVPGLEIRFCSRRDPALADKLRDVEAIIGDANAAILAAAPKVKWVQSGAAGMEGMDQALRDSPVVVTNCARIFAPGITETGMGMLLSLTRGISKYYVPQFAKHQMQPVGTPQSNDYSELGGKTMVIAGFGGIGSTMARRAHYGFDMRVLATDAKPLPKPEYLAELHDPTAFEKLVPQADVLVTAAPLTPQTRRMINDRVLRNMKKTAYYLALSRGGLFDDMALVSALKEGRIAGAGLDVFPVEPPPAEHPIYDCPNVVMTAHTSGWGPERQVRLIQLYAENLRRFSEGLPLVNVVDKVRGY